MRSLTALGLALGLGLSSVAAQAMPFSAAPVVSESMATKVAYGCGPGMTRGPYGYCRPRFTCPPGWHPGPYGYHCYRNRW
jgi:hypothetical protein